MAFISYEEVVFSLELLTPEIKFARRLLRQSQITSDEMQTEDTHRFRTTYDGIDGTTYDGTTHDGIGIAH